MVCKALDALTGSGAVNQICGGGVTKDARGGNKRALGTRSVRDRVGCGMRVRVRIVERVVFTGLLGGAMATCEFGNGVRFQFRIWLGCNTWEGTQVWNLSEIIVVDRG